VARKERLDRYMDSFVETFDKFCKKRAIKSLDEEAKILLFQIFMDTFDDTPPNKRSRKR